MSKSFQIREVNVSDFDSLSRFFRQAYGHGTVFQDHEFIRWYLGIPERPGRIESLIAVDSGGQILAHYGGIPFQIMLLGEPISAVWGVNAFTLPKWRGMGIGNSLVEKMKSRYDVFGVIGFTPKTADFYAASGFNVFEKRRYERFVFPLTEGVWEASAMVGGDPDVVRGMFPIKRPVQLGHQNVEVIGKDSFAQLNWSPTPNLDATSYRNRSWVGYRFFDNRYVSYRCLAIIEQQNVCAALFTRKEPLMGTRFQIDRIIDMFGDVSLASELLSALVERARYEDLICVEGSIFGGTFESAFSKAGYIRLQGDDVSLLPQVTSPVESRPNHEFVGLFSERFTKEIENLRRVHFTRADSDRDRVSQISQIH